MKKLFTILSAAAMIATGSQAAVKTQEVTIQFTDYYYEQFAEPQTTTVAYNDGIFTIENFFNSGLAVNFTIPLDKDSYPMTGEYDDWQEFSFLEENMIAENFCHYLYDYEKEDYGTGYIYGYNDAAADEATEVTKLFVYDSWYNNVAAYVKEDGSIGLMFDIYVTFPLLGEWGDACYMSFDLDDLAGIFSETAVETIENAVAPMEYYDLNGVRVMNPKHGIFIQRQGNKTVEVMK